MNTVQVNTSVKYHYIEYPWLLKEIIKTIGLLFWGFSFVAILLTSSVPHFYHPEHYNIIINFITSSSLSWTSLYHHQLHNTIFIAKTIIIIVIVFIAFSVISFTFSINLLSWLSFSILFFSSLSLLSIFFFPFHQQSCNSKPSEFFWDFFLSSAAESSCHT